MWPYKVIQSLFTKSIKWKCLNKYKNTKVTTFRSWISTFWIYHSYYCNCRYHLWFIISVCLARGRNDISPMIWKISLCLAREKNIIVNERNNLLTEMNFFSLESSTIACTFWDSWIQVLIDEIQNNHMDLQVHNLSVKMFWTCRILYLTTKY